MTAIFHDFDFSVLDNPAFKEDAVREEIIAPILRKAGFRPSGELRVERSKSLLHPFVMIGSKKHRVHIIPDYTLYDGHVALMTLDAKNPSEPIVRSHHVEQAYSYAIHPEVRCRNYGLCNGREFAIFHTQRWEPVVVLDVASVDSRWDEFASYLDTSYLKMPEIRDFAPDFGLYVRMVGFDEGTGFTFGGIYLQLIAKIADDHYTVNSMGRVYDSETEHLMSFDFNSADLEKIISALPANDAHRVRTALARSPFQADLAGHVVISCEAKLGPVTRGQYEPFAPFRISEISMSRYDPDGVLNEISNGARPDTPDWVFRLTRR